MRCKICGTENKDGMLFCTECGAPLKESKKPDGTWQLEQEETSIPTKTVKKEPETVSEEYRPITMWGYFGYELLFSIPVIGFIFLIVYSLGGTRNINLKNFARSYFCFSIIVIIFIAIMFLLYGSSYVNEYGTTI